MDKNLINVINRVLQNNPKKVIIKTKSNYLFEASGDDVFIVYPIVHLSAAKMTDLIRKTEIEYQEFMLDYDDIEELQVKN